MAIEVHCEAAAGGWRCTVQVADRGGETAHVVAVAEGDLAWLDPGASDPRALVRTSFEFLLERESNASILRSFDLPEIARYFQEYEAEIRRRLATDSGTKGGR